MSRSRARVLIALAPCVAACGVPAVLDPAGPQAATIGTLWWWFFAVCLIVYALVVGVLAGCVVPQRRTRARLVEPDVLPPDPAAERRRGRLVAGATATTAALLLVLLTASIVTGRHLARASARDPLRIEVTGHQWWWHVRYPATPESDTVVTANELHVPTGRDVRLELRSSDVIHSLWVPRLHGKRDLIPGRETELQFRVDEPGHYVGQCAEFCGHQHAHMLLRVVAEDQAAFDAWLAAQRAPAGAPRSSDETQGQSLFNTRSCVLCHAVRGTDAGGQVGPDLTHIASRGFIAAGILPNAADHLARWIVDSQAIKPGNRMPPNALSEDETRLLVAYLRSLR